MTGNFFGWSLQTLIIADNSIFINLITNDWNYGRTYMQKAGDCGDKSPQIFLDFPQNFRLRTRNQYCAQAIA